MENVISEWLRCPVCGNKTRLKIRGDTELKYFPLFCPKCRQETLINVKHLNTTVIKEPDAQTHRRRADNTQIKMRLSALLFFLG